MVFDVVHCDRLVASLPLDGVLRGGFADAELLHFVIASAHDPSALFYVSVTKGPRPSVRRRVALRPAASKQASRPMRPQSAPADDFVDVFPVAGVPHIFSFGAGDGLLTAVHRNRTTAAPVPARGLRMDAVHSLTAHGARDGPVTLLLAGAWQGQGQVVVLPVGPSAQAQPLALDALPFCSAPVPCHAAVAAEVTADGRLFLVLLTGDDVAVACLNGTSHALLRYAVVPGVGPGATVGGVAFDGAGDTLLLWVRRPGAPGAVYKFRPDSLVLYETVRTGAAEELYALRPVPALRTMYSLSGAGNRTAVSTSLLYTVADVDPPLADAAGGTVLRVSGRGFADLGTGLYCQFSGAITMAATFKSPSLIECRAPEVPISADRPGADTVEVLLLPGLATRSGVQLQRPASPRLEGLAPDLGYFAEAQWLRVLGDGFAASPHLSCHFLSAGVARAVGADAVRRVSPTEVYCRRPALPAPPAAGPLSVVVCNDGQTPGPHRLNFTVVGPAATLRSRVDRVWVRAAALAPIPGVALFTADQWDRPLGAWHNETALLRLRAVPDGAVNVTGSVAELQAGVAHFRDLALVRPRAGHYVLLLAAAPLPLPPIEVVVVAGAPAALRIVRQPSREATAATPLAVQPVVELKDAVGNQVLWLPEPGLRLHACVRPAPSEGDGFLGLAVFGDDARFTFTGITVPVTHGSHAPTAAHSPGPAAALSRPWPGPCPFCPSHVVPARRCCVCASGRYCDVALHPLHRRGHAQSTAWNALGSDTGECHSGE